MINNGRCTGRLLSLLATSMLVFTSAVSQTIRAPTATQTRTPQEQPTLPTFDVASVKPNHSPTDQFRLAFTPDGVRVQNASLLLIVRAAYGMFNSLDDKFIGIPSWAKSEKFDIEAKVAPADIPTFQKLDFDHRQLMVQALLKDRFKLHAHTELRQQPIYDLVIAKGGSKLQPSKSTEAATPGGTIKRERTRITAQNIVLSQLSSTMTQAVGRTVLNKTDLAGKYDLTLNWTPDEPAPIDSAAPADPTAPSIFTAVQEQLGLKLQPSKAPVDCLIIDHIEMPSAN